MSDADKTRGVELFEMNTCFLWLLCVAPYVVALMYVELPTVSDSALVSVTVDPLMLSIVFC